MGYVTNYRDATRTVTTTNTGTRTAYRTAYETKEAQLGYDAIPIIRANFTYFTFTGLRPNTPHWIFFDGKNVTKWVNTSYNSADYNDIQRNNPIRNPGEKYIDSTSFPAELGGPTAASGPVYTDASGNLDGLFYIQSNADTNFPVGNRTLAVIDISILNKSESLSFAQAEYSAIGEYELYYQFQQAYQQAYQETYQYTTSYTETYQESYQTWVDDPVYVPDPVDVVVPPVVVYEPDPDPGDDPDPTPVDPVEEVVEEVPIYVPEVITPPPDPEPPIVSSEPVESGATTTKKSSDNGGSGSSNMVKIYNPNDNYNYWTTEAHANIMEKDQGWTNKGKVNDSGSGGSDDANNSSSNKIVCTEMYRQTQLADWSKAMRIWDIYQKRHLTPTHEIGYHWLFKPYVRGMQKSNNLTKLGAYLAKERTQHLKHVLTKGKARDSIVGNVWCKIIHPVVHIAGKVKLLMEQR